MALPVFLMRPVLGQANAGSPNTAFDWTGTYAGVFAGYGKAANRIVDVEGFANWGYPGWAVGYRGSGFVGGALIGKKFEIAGAPLRVEIDTMSVGKAVVVAAEEAGSLEAAARSPGLRESGSDRDPRRKPPPSHAARC